MPRKHALAVAALLALGAVAGTVAATRATPLGAAIKPAAASQQLSERARRLDAIEASLDRALRSRPPALPALRSESAAPSAAAAPVAAPAAPLQVVYERPAPIVVTKPRGESGYELEAESEHAAEAGPGDGRASEGDDD